MQLIGAEHFSTIMSNEPGNRFIDRRVARAIKREGKIAAFPSNNFFGVVWYYGGLWYALLSRFGCIAEVIVNKKLTEVYRLAFQHWEMAEYPGKLSAEEMKHRAMRKMLERCNQEN